MLKKLVSHLFCQPHMERRIPVLLISVCLMGAGIAVFDQIQFGTDPCSVFNLAFAQNVLGWKGLGTWQLIINMMLLITILLLREGKRIGLGSLANMILVGYSKDAFDLLINAVHPLRGAPMSECIIAFVPALIVFLLAVSFYMVAELGVAPYDAIPQIISARLKLPFAPVRMAFDLCIAIAGLLLGGTIGVVTILLGFFIGPLVQIIANKFRPWFQ